MVTRKKKATTRRIMAALRKKASQSKARVWKDLIWRIDRPRRIRTEVNVDKINKLAQKYKDKIFVVPGKVLGTGELEHCCRVAALAFTNTAKSKINKQGEAIPLQKLVEMDVKASELIIVE
jgi:large subunit ribosomal protein L18e